MALLIGIALPGRGAMGTTGVAYDVAKHNMAVFCTGKKPSPTPTPAALGELTNALTAALIASHRDGGMGAVAFWQVSSAAGHSIEPDLSCMMKTSVTIGLACRL